MQLNSSIHYCKNNGRPEGLNGRSDTDENTREKPARDPGALLCRACGRVITHDRDRLSVQGAHLHTFANPQGRVFEIGCFQSAVGCGYGEGVTAEFTWFAGYQWKIAVCAGCLTHVGWLFICATSQFHGLILDRLVRGREW
jgi:hypothetical protein